MELIIGNIYTIRRSVDSLAYYKATIGVPVTLVDLQGDQMAKVTTKDGKRWLIRPWDILSLENGNNEDYASLLKEEE